MLRGPILKVWHGTQRSLVMPLDADLLSNVLHILFGHPPHLSSFGPSLSCLNHFSMSDLSLLIAEVYSL